MKLIINSTGSAVIEIW